jgi:D-sedoheptulose 7-phosphate isomerase
VSKRIRQPIPFLCKEKQVEREKGYSGLLDEHNSLFAKLHEVKSVVEEAAQVITNALRNGNKIMICGNGGSASDAQHFAAELVGRFEAERKALPGIALTTDTSILTALGNDYGYEAVFSRQVEGLSVPGDALVGISTSGNSKNILLAVRSAKAIGLSTIGLLGRDGGALASEVDVPVIVPHSVTARIQEAHIFIVHFWADSIERELFSPKIP